MKIAKNPAFLFPFRFTSKKNNRGNQQNILLAKFRGMFTITKLSSANITHLIIPIIDTKPVKVLILNSVKIYNIIKSWRCSNEQYHRNNEINE